MSQAERGGPVMRTCTWTHHVVTVVSALALVALGTVLAVAPVAVTAGAVGSGSVPAEAPLPPEAGSNPSAQLSQSACAAPHGCVAVGSFVDRDNTRQILIETGASGTWSARKGPLPGDANANPEASLTGLSCPAPGSCVAVGSYVDDQGVQRALVDTLAGGSWTPTEALLPSDAGTNPVGQLNAVSCATSSSCVAVGSYDTDAPAVDRAPLIETLSGHLWTPAPAGLPDNAHEGNLTGVSCPTGGSCVAVGVYGLAVISDGLVNEDTLPLVITLSTGTWTPSAGALPADADTRPIASENVEFLGVSCVAAGPCVATGSYMTGDGSQLALVETLSDGTWTVGSLSLPSDAVADAPLSALLSVSCAAGPRCVAVGNYLNSSGDQRPLVENLSGGTWTPVQAPLPSNANSITSAVLDGAAIGPSGSSVAVGSYQDAGGNTQGALDVEPSPAPAVTTSPVPTGVPTTAAPATVPAPTPTTAPAPPESSTPGQPAIALGPDGALWFTDARGHSIDRVSTSGAVTRVTAPSIDAPSAIALGPDGALWFTDQSDGSAGDAGSIGRITPTGVVSNYAGPGISDPGAIALGPDGALWFTDQSDGSAGDAGSIGRITPTGVVSNYAGPGISDPGAIALGPDGALWFVDATHSGHPSIGRISLTGAVTTYPTGPDGPIGDIALGPDGAVWFTSAHSIGRITTAGVVGTYSSPAIDGAAGIARGPDGAMWFTNQSGGPDGTGSIGRITTAGMVTSFSNHGVVAPTGIVSGPDGALWFTNRDGSIGRLPGAGSGGPQLRP